MPREKSNLLSDDDRARVDRALGEAESKTSIEIVPAIAYASGRYDRAEDLVGLWGGLVLAGLVWYFFQGIGVDDGAWDDEPYVVVGFWTVALSVVVGFIAGAVGASRWTGLRRLFTPNREMEAELVTRAKAVFFDGRAHRESRAPSVLIYVSLYERGAVLLADETVRERLSERSLEEVRDRLVEGVREGGVASGLVGALERLGALLEVSMPSEGEKRSREGKVLLLDSVP